LNGDKQQTVVGRNLGVHGVVEYMESDTTFFWMDNLHYTVKGKIILGKWVSPP
jgi:hypothetical protein